MMILLGIGTCIYPPYHQYQCSVYSYIYTCDIGSSVGQYFGIDTGLQVECIPKNICLADISISEITSLSHYVNSWYWYLPVLVGIAQRFCYQLYYIPVITVFLADTYNLKI